MTYLRVPGGLVVRVVLQVRVDLRVQVVHLGLLALLVRLVHLQKRNNFKNHL